MCALMLAEVGSVMFQRNELQTALKLKSPDLNVDETAWLNKDSITKSK